jgi:hypothetical protein
MAILSSHGILLVDAVPSHTPGVGQATLARLDGSMTFWSYYSGTWNKFDLYFPSTFTGNIISNDANIGTALQELETAVGAIVSDGNHSIIVRADAIVDVDPTNVEVPSPLNGDTAAVYLTDGTAEYWVFTTVWTKAYSQSIATPLFSTIADTNSIDLTLVAGELKGDVRLATPNANIALSIVSGGLLVAESKPTAYASRSAATTALGANKKFIYTVDNTDGVPGYVEAWT